jgi:hypothetical protein
MGLGVDENVQIEGTLQVAKSSATRIVVEGLISVYGLRLAGATIPLDVHASGRLEGDPANIIDLQDGLVTVGNLKGRLGGKGVFVRDGFRIDGQWRTAPRACDKVTTATDVTLANLAQLATSLAGLERPGGANATSGGRETQLAGTFTIDSRDLGRTRVTGAPTNKCAKLFP